MTDENAKAPGGTPESDRGLDLLSLDAALDELAALDTQQSRIVELKYFGGLTIAETAEALGLSHATVERDWALARAWMFQRLRSE